MTEQCAWNKFLQGFDGLFFARIDFEDKIRRLNYQELEMVWEAGNSALGI